MSTNDVRTLLGIVTEDEFGRAVGVVGPTIALWRNNGEGPPYFQFKRNIFYRTADIVQWVIENTRDARSGEFLVPRPAPTMGWDATTGKSVLIPAVTRPKRSRKRKPTLASFYPVPELNSGELRPDGTRAPSVSATTQTPPPELGIVDIEELTAAPPKSTPPRGSSAVSDEDPEPSAL